MGRIRLQDMTPSVYYGQSRDFQFIGRLFDAVLNSSKAYADSLYDLPLGEFSDQRLIDLMATTLGFKSRHTYNVRQMTSLCSAFCQALRNKGNIQSIMLAVRALLNAEGIKEDMGYGFDQAHTTISLYIPQELSDVNLLRDLLDYILPAGMGCRIIREFKVETTASSQVHGSDSASAQSLSGEQKTTLAATPAEMSALANAKPGGAKALMNGEIYIEEEQ